MMTDAERRGVLLVVGLLLLGVAWDVFRAVSSGPPVDPVAGPSVPVDTLEPAVRDSVEPVPAPEALDLNRATADELDRLPGVGPVLARRIVDQRERHGPFQSVDELRAVRGIGDRLLARIRGRLRIGPR